MKEYLSLTTNFFLNFSCDWSKLWFFLINEHTFARAPITVLAIPVGFVLCGLIPGIPSVGITIFETGISDVFLCLLFVLLIPLLNIRGLLELSSDKFVLTSMNENVLSIASVWVVKNLISHQKITDKSTKIHWNWILAWCNTGKTFNLFTTSVLSRTLEVYYPPPIIFIYFIFGLFIIGFIKGWRSFELHY